VKGEGSCQYNHRGSVPLPALMKATADHGLRKETVSAHVQSSRPEALPRPAGSIIAIKDFIPDERLWPTLTSMGKRPWLKHVQTQGLGFEYRTDYGTLKGIDSAAALATVGAALSAEFAVTLYLVSRSLACGPKVWRPEWHHCIAFEYSDLRLPWDELRLAYDPLLIDFPPQYAERWRDYYGDNLPMGAIIGKIGPDSLGIIVRHRQGVDSWFVLHRRPECETVEDTLRAVYRETGQYVATNSLDPDDYLDTADNTLRRVVLNAAVTLGMIGSKVAGWANPHDHEGNARKTNRAARSRAAADARRVEPIRVFVGIRFVPPREQLGGSRPRTGPFFRRGHHKMQPYGPGRAYRKLQWREPQLCNASPDTDPKDYPRRYEGF
jgi:hypothetical protein